MWVIEGFWVTIVLDSKNPWFPNGKYDFILYMEEWAITKKTSMKLWGRKRKRAHWGKWIQAAQLINRVMNATDSSF